MNLKDQEGITSAEELVSLMKEQSTIHDLIIKGQIKINSLDIKGNFEFINCEFLDEFDLRINNISNIFFQKCKFRHRLLLSGSYNNISLLSCTFYTFFTAKNLTCSVFKIDECIVENYKLTQLQEFKCKSLLFRRNYFQNDVLIKPTALDSLIIEGGEKNYLITYSGLDIEKPLESLSLFCYTSYKTDYLLRSFKAEKLQLIGELKDSILNINNCQISHGIIHGFINLGTLIFNGLNSLSENSVIILKTSLLGKAQINNTDFSSFKKVILESSNLVEISPVNVIWCKNSKINLESKNLQSHKENLRQLKIISIKSEDIENKLFFHKLEMLTLLAINKKDKKKFNDKFILQTNSLSNNFGLSWSKALAWLMGTSIFFYFAIKLILGYKYFDPGLILDDCGKILLFINPIHQFDKLFNVELNTNTNGAIFVDSAFKILSAYLIYQFISSFRKYSQK